MLKEIGSNFWLAQGEKRKTEIDKQIFNIDFNDYVFTASGRSAISLILSELNAREKRVLLPSFTCESVIEPFIKRGYQVSYYSVDNNLNIDKSQFIDEVNTNKPNVILIHNYFGFDTSSEIRGIVQSIRNQGTVVIEDITQTLYSSYTRLSADYYVGSFRKWIGIPDGGFALKVNGVFDKKPEKEDVHLVEAKINAMNAKYEYLFHDVGVKEHFLDLFSEAEELLENETEIFRMSDFSCIEQANLNIIKIKKRRRDNFCYLRQKINTSLIKPLFSNLPDDVTPLYFPILCKGNRSSIQSWLRSNQIFAPIVWPKPEIIGQADGMAEYCYKDLLCIPIDQRYELGDIERIVNVLECWKMGGTD